MLERERGVTFESRIAAVNQLPDKTGQQVAGELAGRYLLRYLLFEQIHEFINGSDDAHWVTPTPIAPSHASKVLALFQPQRQRKYVMLLRPELIPTIRGPRWIPMGHGIEYYLPHGFPRAALAGFERSDLVSVLAVS